MLFYTVSLKNSLKTYVTTIFYNICYDRKLIKTYSACLDSNYCGICVFVQWFFFLVQPAFVDFSTVNSASVHCLRTHKFHFSAIFSLKMGPTILFTHLKIISLQCFSVFSFSFQFSAVSKRTLNQLFFFYKFKSYFL